MEYRAGVQHGATATVYYDTSLTTVFGTDPRRSVLDLNCKCHELDNLYVTDGGFFPSIGAVNPTLTIIANALRVGDHIAALLR